jgi:hypothetical protein
MLIEALERDEKKIAQTGAEALAAARAAGVPAYSMKRSGKASSSLCRTARSI